MPTPRRGASGAKLSIELLPSTVNLGQTDVNVPVVSTQISTVGHTSNFYIQLIPAKSVEKFEPLPLSYVLLTNGRITLTGEFTIQPTKECQSKTKRTIQPEVQGPPVCVFNGTLPIQITRNMMPYSTLLVYTFQPSFGFNVAESYRFSVAGLFQSTLALNATIVPFTPSSTFASDDYTNSNEDGSSSEDVDLNTVSVSKQAQGKTRVELSFTGAPGSTVGLNVVEYDGIIQGLSNEITKERLLHYLTKYEQVPIVGMPTAPLSAGQQSNLRTRNVDSDNENIFSQPSTDSSVGGVDTDDSRKREMKVPPKNKYNGPRDVPVRNVPDQNMQPRAIVSEEEEEQNILREHSVC